MSRTQDEVQFEAWQNDSDLFSINAHPFTGQFGRHYYPKVFGSDAIDVSFAVADNAKPLLLALCSINNRRLDYYGMPIRLFVRNGLEPDVIERAVGDAFGWFDELAIKHGIERIDVADDKSGQTLSSVGKQCLNRNSAAEMQISAICDLRKSEAELKRGLRKSYRSLVNWGQRNLRTSYVGKENPDRSLFQRYQEFHRDVAGRSTRSQQSWDSMFECIVDGRGELVLGYLDGKDLVAGTMVVDGTEIASYASGVYDRKRFDKPMAHWPLWLAVMRSAARGMVSFDLGDVPLTGADQKEIDIGYFKRGFSNQLSTWITWNWKPAKAASHLVETCDA